MCPILLCRSKISRGDDHNSGNPLTTSVAGTHRKNADADPGKNLDADADLDPDADADSCPY
jgi:hypothetical protein